MDPVGKSQKTASRTAAIEGGEGRLGHGYLDGQLLVAMPQMRDARFTRSVIYVCAHTGDGAMGLVVNRLVGSLTFPDLLQQLSIDFDFHCYGFPDKRRREFRSSPSKIHTHTSRAGPAAEGQHIPRYYERFYMFLLFRIGLWPLIRLCMLPLEC